MNREQVLAMSDAELVAAVAELVMGNVFLADDGSWMRQHSENCVSPWSPLTDWNHCMMVASALEAKGWDWAIEREKGFGYRVSVMWDAWPSGSTYREGSELCSKDNDPRKTFMQAALIVTTEKST